MAPAPHHQHFRAGERVAQRSERLIPDEEKVARADFAYVNDSSLMALREFVAGVLRDLGE